MRRRGLARVLLALPLLLALPGGLAAHEVRPAYLELEMAADGSVAVTFKVPRLLDRQPALEPELPASCEPLGRRTARLLPGAVVQRWRLDCPDLLASSPDAVLGVSGLEATLMDVLLRLRTADGPDGAGQVYSALLRPDRPRIPVAELVGEGRAGSSRASVSWSYFLLGVEHIAGGIDHLLFVAALVLVLRRGRLLVQAVTAFTLAHSLTLGLATLGLVRVPGPPVEAVIALSILFLAVELSAAVRGQATLTARRPWTVTLSFGLLHGFGFAGALAEAGLPAAEIPRALLFFNLGVEAGQLLFVGVLLAGLAVLAAGRRLLSTVSVKPFPAWSRQLPAYTIGTAAAFWLCQRLAGFF